MVLMERHETEAAAPCRHHWIIDPPSGRSGYSEGICKLCTEVREFSNVIDVVEWGDAIPLPAKVRREMQEIENIAARLVFDGHERPKVLG